MFSLDNGLTWMIGRQSFRLCEPQTDSRLTFCYAFSFSECGTQLAHKDVPASESRQAETRFDHGIVAQFSITNLGTRANSRVLFVTSVNSRLRAWAAMNKSLAPIIVPTIFKAARI